MKKLCFIIILLISGFACTSKPDYDIVIRNGTIYDGSGSSPFAGDIAINADTIAAVGSLNQAKGKQEIDVGGMVVAPGFINMLSWATESLIEDGLSQSDIRQGVTLEVFGEGWSYGPYNEKMKQEEVESQADIKYDIEYGVFFQEASKLANFLSILNASLQTKFSLKKNWENCRPGKGRSLRGWRRGSRQTARPRLQGHRFCYCW